MSECSMIVKKVSGQGRLLHSSRVRRSSFGYHSEKLFWGSGALQGLRHREGTAGVWSSAQPS